METVLEEIKTGLENGTLSKEEAKILLDDIQTALEMEDDCLDIVMKGQMLTTLSTLLKLV
ncbi:MAG: hypothetical protein P8I94_04060 [Emcibacteraceae bacterium]|nr:hypothetical protein [Emcibacteraceae bacterium]